MNICVTGGAGFLGSHLVDALLEQGHYVTVIDNYVTGSPKNLENAFGKYPKKLDVQVHDISKFDIDLQRRLNKRKYDVVFNFACPASPVSYQADPIQTMMTCVLGTKNMLDFAVSHDAIFIHASTSEIYGDPEIHPQHEDYKGCVNTLGIRACYDEGKRAAETIIFDYKRTKSAKVKVARIFNTFGPRMAVNDGRVVSNFIVQALTEKPITIYGKGKQTRSFCYVSDLIAGFLALMNSRLEFTGPVNLGNPDEFTIFELYQKIQSLLPKKQFSVNFSPLPQDDPKQRKPDISLAQAELFWEPKVKLADGLQYTIEYFEHKV